MRCSNCSFAVQRMVWPLYARVTFEWAIALSRYDWLHDKPKKIWKLYLRLFHFHSLRFHFHLIFSQRVTVFRARQTISRCFLLFFAFCFDWDSLFVWVFCCNSSEWRSNCITHHFHVLYFRILYGFEPRSKGLILSEQEMEIDRGQLQHCDDSNVRCYHRHNTLIRHWRRHCRRHMELCQRAKCVCVYLLFSGTSTHFSSFSFHFGLLRARHGKLIYLRLFTVKQCNFV